MATYTATERRSHLLAATSHGGAYDTLALVSTIELAVATAFPRTVDFGRIPSNARLLGKSRLYWDDLSNAATPTLDLGIGAVKGNLANADDANALSDGHALHTASTGAVAITAFAEHGNEAWDFVASETSDPDGELMVYGTVADVGTAIEGTITLELYYNVD